MAQSVSDQELSRQSDIGRSTTSHGTPLPPSVEKAYYRKCIELKRRINDVEDANDTLRVRRARINRAILKMRLERAFLLEQLQKRMTYNPDGSDRSESPPPTPQDKPLRSKRAHRKTTPPTVTGGGTSAQLSPPENPGRSSATRAVSSNRTTPDARAAGNVDSNSTVTQPAALTTSATNGSTIAGRGSSSRGSRGDLTLFTSAGIYNQPLHFESRDTRRVSSSSNATLTHPGTAPVVSREEGSTRIPRAEYRLPSLGDGDQEAEMNKANDGRRSSGGQRSHHHHHHHHQQHQHPHRDRRDRDRDRDRDQERRHHHHHHHHHNHHSDARAALVADVNGERRRVSSDTEMGEALHAGGGSGSSREGDGAGFTAVNR